MYEGDGRPGEEVQETDDWRDDLINHLVKILGKDSKTLERELGGKFAYNDVLHESGHAKLYYLKAAESQPNNPGVIVKFFEDGYQYDKFLAEIDLYRQLKGTFGIIQPLASIVNREQPIIIYSYYPAGDLIQQYNELNRLPSLEEVIKIVEALGSGLATMHRRGVAHRDIKGSNVFVTDQEGFSSVGLADFDYSSIMIPFDEKIARSGTIQFMPPDAFLSTDYDYFLADQYALAILIYELFSEWNLPFGEVHERLAVISRKKNATQLERVQAATAFIVGDKVYQPLENDLRLQQLMPIEKLRALDTVLKKGMSIEERDRFLDPVNPSDTKLAINPFIEALLDVLRN